jgi:hypothetical protein
MQRSKVPEFAASRRHHQADSRLRPLEKLFPFCSGTAVRDARARVIHRRGELNKDAIDPGRPHRVALPASRCSGANHVTMPPFS